MFSLSHISRASWLNVVGLRLLRAQLIPSTHTIYSWMKCLYTLHTVDIYLSTQRKKPKYMNTIFYMIKPLYKSLKVASPSTLNVHVQESDVGPDDGIIRIIYIICEPSFQYFIAKSLNRSLSALLSYAAFFLSLFLFIYFYFQLKASIS